LTELTKEGTFIEENTKDTKVLQVFEVLEETFAQKLLLIHFEFRKPRIIQVDSSGYAVAAILNQTNEQGELQPVSYSSRN
jgi:hypothetical protein